MIISKRIALLAGFGFLWLGFPSDLPGQEVSPTVAAFLDESVPEMLESFRSGGPTAPSMRASSLIISITEEPEKWSRARLDSLSEGLVEVILEKQAGNRPAYGVALGVLTTDVDLPGRRHVGTFNQLVSIFDADLEHFPRIAVLEHMGKFGDEPRVVAFLARVVRAPSGEFNGGERTMAMGGLTLTELGRNRLRAMHQGNAKLHPDVARYLQVLATRDFRRWSGGGGADLG